MSKKYLFSPGNYWNTGTYHKASSDDGCPPLRCIMKRSAEMVFGFDSLKRPDFWRWNKNIMSSFREEVMRISMCEENRRLISCGYKSHAFSLLHLSSLFWVQSNASDRQIIWIIGRSIQYLWFSILKIESAGSSEMSALIYQNTLHILEDRILESCFSRMREPHISLLCPIFVIFLIYQCNITFPW
jgi:hypothetical protein